MRFVKNHSPKTGYMRYLNPNAMWVLKLGIPSSQRFLSTTHSTSQRLREFRCFESKRGVSPLIATILLIAFAVALGSVIMNWGLSLSLASDDPCQQVMLEIKQLADGELCYGSRGGEGYLNFALENRGSADIAGISVWITGQKKTELIDLNGISIPRRAIYEKSGSETLFDFSTLGNLDSVQFIPKIMVDGKMHTCTKQAIQPKNIRFC